MGKIKTVFDDCDILVVGGGMAGTGATFEARYWGRDLKIVCVEKANIDRSGAVAQGLHAPNPLRRYVHNVRDPLADSHSTAYPYSN